MAQYHVTLDGQGYLLDLDRYARRVRDPFVAKQSVGSVAIGDLRGPEQVLVLSDWSGGEGYVQHDEAHPGRFRWGAGIDGYSRPGTLRLGPYVSTVGTSAGSEVRSLCGFGTKLFGGTDVGKLYTWDGASFTLVRTLASAASVLNMATFLGKLYFVNAGNVGSFDGTTWSETLIALAAGTSRCLLTHFRQAAQYLYIGVKSGGVGGLTGRVVYWDGAVLSGGQFDPEELFAEVMFVLGSRLYVVGCETGTNNWALYSVDNAGAGGNWQRHLVVPGAGFPTGAAVEDGVAYVGDAANPLVYRWDGSGLSVAIDGTLRDTPFSGTTQALVGWRGAAWFGALDSPNAASGTGAVLRYGDDGALFRVASGLAGGGFRSATVFLDRMYLGTSEAGAAKVMKVDPTLYGGSGVVTSGVISFGLPGVSKLLRSVTLVTAALPAGHSVKIEYQLEDTGAWTTLGTFSTTGGTSVTYSFGANTTCKLVAFRLTLTGSAGTANSPVVHELAVRYTPRPAVTREWELAIILEGTAELPLITLDGAAESLTGAQLSAALWTAAIAAGPVTLVDLDGVSYSVYVQDVREEVARISQRKGYQRVGLVNLVEAA